MAGTGHSRYSSADLTARTRIREAALGLIAERGVRGTTVRGIAERSGVSPSLVVHHFGTKQAIVDEVSAWALRLVSDATAEYGEGAARASAADAHHVRLAGLGRVLDETPDLAGFLRRMLVDGRPEGLAWFRASVAAVTEDLRVREADGLARTSSDVPVVAAALVVLGLAPLLLQPLLEHALDVDLSKERDRQRWRAAQRELLTSALYPPEPPVGG